MGPWWMLWADYLLDLLRLCPKASLDHIVNIRHGNICSPRAHVTRLGLGQGDTLYGSDGRYHDRADHLVHNLLRPCRNRDYEGVPRVTQATRILDMIWVDRGGVRLCTQVVVAELVGVAAQAWDQFGTTRYAPGRTTCTSAYPAPTVTPSLTSQNG
jgi:hypothetical protein